MLSAMGRVSDIAVELDSEPLPVAPSGRGSRGENRSFNVVIQIAVGTIDIDLSLGKAGAPAPVLNRPLDGSAGCDRPIWRVA